MKKINITYSITVLLMVGLIVLTIFLQKDNARLKLDIEKREALLSSALTNDSTWMAKQDSIINTVEKTIFFYAGDKKMNGDEFVKYVNSIVSDYNNLSKEYNNLVNAYDTAMDSLQYFKQYFAMSQDILDSKFKAELDTLTNRIKYSISYTRPQDKQYEKLSRDSKILELITEKYNIIIKDLENGYITFESPQIDSALMLLPYHREELEYLPEQKCWIIKRNIITTKPVKKTRSK